MRYTPESLSADRGDASPYRRFHAASAWPFYRNTVLVLALFGMGGYAVWHYTDRPRQVSPPMAVPPAHQFERPLPTPEPRLPAVAQDRPRPLADCIGTDNLIDEGVLKCRFGELPRPTHDNHAQGMVSAAYLAQYKAGQQRAASVPARSPASYVATALVPRWDGRGVYQATWTITDNRIEGSSVCGNWRKGSIESRECRKGAKVYFRQQCTVWRKRVALSDSGEAQRQRYCSAAQVFNPLG